MEGSSSSPDHPHGVRRRRRTTRRRRLIFWFGLMAILFVGLVTARPALHWFKATRSAQLAKAADDLASAGKLNEAADKFRAALQLDPIGYPALQGAARLASRVGRPEALDLWEQVVKTPRATTSDRQHYAEQLLRDGRPRLAAAVIEGLLKSAPDGKTLELASQYARAVGDRNKALEFSRLAVARKPNDELVRFHLAELLAESTDAPQRAEARQILWEMAGRPGPYRQSAIEALAAAPELSNDERKQVLDMLASISPPQVKDGLLAADLRLQLDPANAIRTYDEVIARWNNGDVGNLVELGRWLNLHQQSERVLSLFPLEEAVKNNQVLLTRMDALGTLQRWNEIESILSRPDLTLDPSVLECFRARTAQEQNAPLDAELHWNHALSFAAGDPFKLRFVANFAEQSGAANIALKVFDQLAKFPEHAALAYRGIERLSGRAGDLLVQRAAAEKIGMLSPNDPDAQAQIAYLNLLANTEVEASTAKASKLVEAHPDRLSFRVTAALGYLRQHDPGLALAQFKGPESAPPIDWSKTPPAWRAVYAAALRDSERSDAAREIIKQIPVDQLNAEERALIGAR
jgi:hypothetical protein